MENDEFWGIFILYNLSTKVVQHGWVEVFVTSLKEYAGSKHITYEAVRKQTKRYQADLKGHIIKKDGKQYLDDFAIDFLDQKRNSNPIIIEQYEKEEVRIKLEEENKALQDQVTGLNAVQTFLLWRITELNDELLKVEREKNEIKNQLEDLQKAKGEKTLLEKFFDFFKSLF